MPNLSTIRPQFQILVLLEVNLGLKGLKYGTSKAYIWALKASNTEPLRPKFRILDLLEVNFWSFCDLNYKFSSNLRSISGIFGVIQGRVFESRFRI